MNKKNAIRTVVFTALLIAIEVVLNRFFSISNSFLKIGFSFVPITVAAVMFGPITAAVVAGSGDFIGAILYPIGPYFPGFTFTAILMGFVWGVFLRKWKSDGGFRTYLTAVLLPSLINNLILGLILNTAWITVVYGKKTFFGYLVSRIPQQIILTVVECALLPFIIKLCALLKREMPGLSRKQK